MRSRLARWSIRTVVVLTLIIGLAVAYVLVASEWMLRRRHAVPLASMSSNVAGADTAEGGRKAILLGCLEGCHGPQGEGGVAGAPGVFRVVAPTLSDVVPHYTDPELVRLVRYGVRRDGVSAVGMPAATFYPLGDHDLAQVIAHLRKRPPHPPVPRSRAIQPLGRLALALGRWHTSADGVDRSIPRWGEQPLDSPTRRGRYIASVTCSECHGTDLAGFDYMNRPPLSVVRGYRFEQFVHLLRTGEPISGRDLGIMSRTARAAFRRFTDEELRDLYAYLTTAEIGRGAAPRTDSTVSMIR